MKNVLFVDCCIRREASNTRKLAKAFLSRLRRDAAGFDGRRSFLLQGQLF